MPDLTREDRDYWRRYCVAQQYSDRHITVMLLDQLDRLEAENARLRVIAEDAANRLGNALWIHGIPADVIARSLEEIGFKTVDRKAVLADAMKEEGHA